MIFELLWCIFSCDLIFQFLIQVKVLALPMLCLNYSVKGLPRILSSVYYQVHTWTTWFTKLGPTNRRLSNVLQKQVLSSGGLTALVCLLRAWSALVLKILYFSQFTTPKRYLALVVFILGLFDLKVFCSIPWIIVFC